MNEKNQKVAKMNTFLNLKYFSVTVALCIITMLIAGCATKARTGTAGGAGAGALAGGLLSGSTKGALIGAGIGAGVGYIVGNEMDKNDAEKKNKSTPPEKYAHNEVGPLGDTRWKVISLVPKDYFGPYISKIVKFGPNGRVVTTTTNQDGSVDVYNEHFRVVGQTLIVNRPGYLINSRFGIEGDQLIVDSEDFRAVLKRIP